MYIEWNSTRLVGPVDGIVTKTVHKTVADPEFPRGGGANPPGFFSQKQHEIERILIPRGRRIQNFTM